MSLKHRFSKSFFFVLAGGERSAEDCLRKGLWMFVHRTEECLGGDFLMTWETRCYNDVHDLERFAQILVNSILVYRCIVLSRAEKSNHAFCNTCPHDRIISSISSFIYADRTHCPTSKCRALSNSQPHLPYNHPSPTTGFFFPVVPPCETDPFSHATRFLSSYKETRFHILRR